MALGCLGSRLYLGDHIIYICGLYLRRFGIAIESPLSYEIAIKRPQKIKVTAKQSSTTSDNISNILSNCVCVFN